MSVRSSEYGYMTQAEHEACERERARMRERAALGVGGDWYNDEGARLSGSAGFTTSVMQGEQRNPAAKDALGNTPQHSRHIDGKWHPGTRSMQQIIDEVEKEEENALVAGFNASRRTMREAFQRVSGARLSYQANIAMLLHDRYGVTGKVARNAAANDILNLIFEMKGDPIPT